MKIIIISKTANINKEYNNNNNNNNKFNILFLLFKKLSKYNKIIYILSKIKQQSFKRFKK